MIRRFPPQRGYVYERNGSFHIRYYTYERNGEHVQKSRWLCDKTEETPSKDSPRVQELATAFMQGVNEAVKAARARVRVKSPRDSKGQFTKPLQAGDYITPVNGNYEPWRSGTVLK